MKSVRRVTLASAAIALLGLLSLPVTSALAGRSVVHDRRGDAKAGYDLVRISVSNGRKNLSLKVVYRGKLTPRGEPGLGLETGVDIDLGKPDRGTYSGDFSVYNAVGAPGMGNGVILLDKKAHRVSCPGLRAKARVRAGTVRIVVPQRCFKGQAARVRIAGFTYAIRGTGRLPTTSTAGDGGRLLARRERFGAQLVCTVIILAAGTFALAPGSSSAAAVRHCGNLPAAHGASDTITLRGIRGNRPCGLARRVAKQWLRKAALNQCNFVSTCRARGFKCRGYPSPPDSVRYEIGCFRGRGYLAWKTRQILPAD